MKLDAWSAEQIKVSRDVWDRAKFVGYDDCGDVVKDIAAEDKDAVFVLVLQKIADKRKGSAAFQTLRHTLEVNIK